MNREALAGGRDADRADEARLTRAAVAGDPQARREVVLRLMDRVRNTARWIVRNDADADDAAQAAMVEILRSIGTFRGEASLSRWASRIAARTALALVRRGRREDHTVALSREPDQNPSADGPGDAPLIRRRLLRCFDRMPVDRRVTVVLRLVLGCTLEEIARQTGVPLNTAKDRLRIGREELRRAILEDPILRDIVKEKTP